MHPKVETQCGAVRGISGEVTCYLGIPYAKPPTGQNRWRPPQPVDSWPGVLDARQFAFDSFQEHDHRLRGMGLSEDCLYLNVWTPAEPVKERLPVMVWIHGNGYTRGSGSLTVYDGTKLARKGVVVVTLNYRLGLAGFLAHPGLTEESPQSSSGNFALLDQIEALRWVKKNIEAFGGDPDKITVFGQSAGATCIQLLMASPLAKGLINQAILHSPGSMRPMATLATAQAKGLQIGSSITALRALPISALWPLASRLIPTVRDLAAPRGLGPIIDGWIVQGDDMNNYQQNRIAPIPLLVGVTANEGRRLRERLSLRAASEVHDYEVRSFGSDAQIPPAYRIGQNRSPVEILDQVLGDTQFNYGAWMSAREMTRAGGHVYSYRFDKCASGTDIAPTHDDELPYVFGTLEAGGLHAEAQEGTRIPAKDRLLSECMGDAWVQFAKTGTPATAALGDWPHGGMEITMVFKDLPKLESMAASDGLVQLQQYFGHCIQHLPAQH